MKKMKLFSFFGSLMFQKKWRLIVRSCFILLFTAGIQLSAVASQNKTVSLKLSNATVKQLIKAIELQTDLGFVYNLNEIKDAKKVSIAVYNTSVEEVLDQVLSDSGLSYEIEKDVIIIKPGQHSHKVQAEVQNERQIKGYVTDNNGEPLIGVSVVLKGTQNGVPTGLDGDFELTIPKEGGTLIFSFIGMKKQEIVVTNQKKLKVVLYADQDQLDEIVVTGYQNIDGRRKTAAITKVDMKALETRAEPSVDKLLQGQVAGMTVMASSGAPGAVPQIRIRGTSTISGNVQPLWVVDGVILDDPVNVDVSEILTNRSLIASGIGGINVSDIASINVLKDASATAIYGTRAANGVIVITSKSGSSGKTRINYSGSTTIGMRPRIEDAHMMNSKERMDVNLEMLNRNIFKVYSPGIFGYGTSTEWEKAFIDVHDRQITWNEFEDKMRRFETINTDWFDELFRHSISQNHSLSMSGGNAKTTFYVSSSYRDEQSTAKGVGMKTYTGMLKVRSKLRENLLLEAKLDINTRDGKSFFAATSMDNPYEYAINTTRTQPLYNEDGDYAHMYVRDLKYNFIENQKSAWRESKSFGVRGQVNLEWEIIKNLRWVPMFNFSRQNTDEEDVADEDHLFVRDRRRTVSIMDGTIEKTLWKQGGYYKGTDTENYSQTYRNQINYNPVFREHHEVNAVLGQEIRLSEYKTEVNEAYGYNHGRGRQMTPQWELIKQMGQPYWNLSNNKTANLSYYGVLGYTYKKRYTVNFNARTDGSNRFGVNTNNLFQPLWSAGFNYQLKEEKFLQPVKWLSYLTIRGSYGSQGNVPKAAYTDIVAKIGDYNKIPNWTPLRIDEPKNPDLKWEKNYNSNIAIEYGLFNRRVRGTLEYYSKKGVDMLAKRNASDVSGFRSVQVNWASIRNNGIEASLYVKLIDGNDFSWSTNFNVGYNKNEVLDVQTNPDYKDLTNAFKSSYAASAIVGKPLSALYSYRFAGLNDQGYATFYNGEFETDENGNEVEQTSVVGIKDVDALKYNGPTEPPVQGSFTTTFNYKKWTLSAMFMGSFGNVIRLRDLANDRQAWGIEFPDTYRNMPKELADRWRKPGDEETTNIPRIEAPHNYDLLGSPANYYMYARSDLRTVKGDYVRFQNLSLTYNLYSPKLREMGIQNIQLTAQGNNLHVWANSELKGQDPEASGSPANYGKPKNASVSFGNTFLPLTRSFSFSVNVAF